jgi:hypothetical protein
VRCKVLADGALESRFAGNMMMGFGCSRWWSRRSSCRASATSSACSRTRRSSTWGS